MLGESGSSWLCYIHIQKAEMVLALALPSLYSPILAHRTVPYTVKVACSTPINLI